jgi:cytochrome c biogenesis protein CcmG, thiol:disulfide interchange protein DsbE
MGTSRRLGTWTAVAAGVAILVAFAMPSYRQGEASVAGTTAEDFPLQVAGKPVRLSDFRGKVVVLNFWASWCQPCVEEAPSLNRLERHLAPHNALLIGVAADENQAAYEKFLQDQGIVFATYRDPATKDNRSPIADLYGTSMYPETYVIGPDGKIARKLIGYQQWDSPQMLAYFDSLLGKS